MLSALEQMFEGNDWYFSRAFPISVTLLYFVLVSLKIYDHFSNIDVI